MAEGTQSSVNTVAAKPTKVGDAVACLLPKDEASATNFEFSQELDRYLPKHDTS